MLNITFVQLILLLIGCCDGILGQNPNDVCFACADRRNHKDLYADPLNCHGYVQCFYYNETFAIGIPRNCPTGTFWHDAVLQCLPEGEAPCSDICNSQTPPASGCYGVDRNCATYFVCSNTASYPFCCPPSTRFNDSSCSCDADETCTVSCTLPTARSTTVKPAVVLDSSTCQDSFGSILRLIDGQPDLYEIRDAALGFYQPQVCAPGTQFQLETCRCDVAVVNTSPQPRNRQCRLYLPFDQDFNDHSISKFDTFAYGGAYLDPYYSPRGVGCLSLYEGRLEIPGLKSIDFKSQASWCLYFLNFAETGGGLLSNSNGVNGSEMSVILASEPNDAVKAILSLASGQTVDVSSSDNGQNPPLDGFTQICLVYDKGTALFYRNGEFIWDFPTSGDISTSHCPYVVGTDQTFGDFYGSIDEVLICDFAMTLDEVRAHWAGQPSMVNAGLVPDSIEGPTPYTAIQPQPSPYGACGHNKFWNVGEPMSISLGIIGGKPARRDELPWQARIVFYLPGGWMSYCGASVLSESWLLTAAHCCDVASDPQSTIYVLYGALNFDDAKAVRHVSQIVRHPNYTSNFNGTGYMANDFCLLKTSEPVTFDTWSIQPICLPSSCDDICRPDDPVMISGYGYTANYDGAADQGPYWRQLAMAVVKMVGISQCSQDLGVAERLFSDTATLCAGRMPDGGIDICHGDSGGPMACYRNGYFQLNGINSWVHVCGGPRLPSGFGSVCQVLPWIRSYIN